MQCQEKMDRASEQLSRAKSALSLAMKAGMEATRGELLDVIAAVFERVEGAESALRAGENKDAQPGQLTTAGSRTDAVQNQLRVVPFAASASSAS